MEDLVGQKILIQIPGSPVHHHVLDRGRAAAERVSKNSERAENSSVRVEATGDLVDVTVEAGSEQAAIGES